MGESTAKAGVKRAREEMYRRLVLEAAEAVFAEQGFEAARIQDIAAEAGISLGTLYSVFPGKWELYRAVHEARGAELLATAMEVVGRSAGTLDLLLEGIRGYVCYLIDHPNYLRMHLCEGYSWAASSQYRSGEQIEAWERGIELTAALFAQGQSEGLIVDGDPPLLAKMMAAVQQVQLADWVEGGMKTPPDEVIGRIQDHFRRAFVIVQF
jgi:AcrR family transcriptional regulator